MTYRIDEGPELVGVGSCVAAVFGPFSGAGGDDDPVVVLLVEEVGDERLPDASHHSQRHVPALADHAAPGETGCAGRKLEVCVGSFVDARSAGSLSARGADEAGFAASEVTEDTLGV